MQFTLASVLALAATVVALPALEARSYPTVDTYVAELTAVDPAYLAELSTAVVNLDEAAKRDLEIRQGGTCALRGFAVVNGAITPFQGTVTNAAANFGRAVTLTGILPGCSIGLIPQSNCALWSVIDTAGCATARSVTFS